MIKFLRVQRFQVFNILKEIFPKYMVCFPRLRKQSMLGITNELQKKFLWVKYHSGSATILLDFLDESSVFLDVN